MKISLVLFVVLASAAISFAAFTYYDTIDGLGLNGSRPTIDKFTEPTSIWVDSGSLYVDDALNNYIYVISNGAITKRIGSGIGGSNSIWRSRGICMDSGLLYIADTGNARGKIYSGTPDLTSIGPDTVPQAVLPEGIATKDGLIYLTDANTSRIRVYQQKNPNGQSESFGDIGFGNGKFSEPTDIFVSNGRIYVADTGNNRIEVLSVINFTYLDSIGRGKGDITLVRPQGVYVSNDRLYVADTGNSRVVVFTLSGDPLETLGSYGTGDYGLAYPRDVFVADGKLYVADTGNMRVQVFAINDTVSDDVFAQLNSAADQVSAYETLATAASKIDINSKSDCRVLLNLAQDELAAQRVIDAQADIARAESSANKSMTALTQALDYRLPSMVAVSRTRLGNLPDSVSPSERVRVGTMISAVNDNIANKSYVDAVNGIIDIESALSQLEGSAAPSGNGTETDALAQRADFEAKARRITEQMDASQSLAADSNITFSRTEVDIEVLSARDKLDKGDYAGAFSQITDARAKADALTAAVEAQLAKIEDANTAIANADRTVAGIEAGASGAIVKPNMDASKKKIADARAELYQDPVGAAALAAQATATAQAEAQGAAGTNDMLMKGGAAALLTLVGGVAIAAVFIVLVAGRKRRGL